MARPSIAFPTRELWPFVTGGGIGRVLHGAVCLLAEEADVTVITREAFREQYESMRAGADSRLPSSNVGFEFIPDPEAWDLGPFSAFQHCWSALVFDKLSELYPNGGPDLVEFSDYLGEGFVTLQALRSGHPSVRRTRALVRLHTTLEMVDALNGATDPDEERRAIYTLERGSLALADHLLSPGGDVLASYGRFYGATRIAAGMVVPHVIATEGAPPIPDPPVSARTRLLFIGRLERRKGVGELVQAVGRLERDDWELTLVGADTYGAPGGGSMRDHLEQLADGGNQLTFHDRVPLERVLDLIDDHHVVVIPSPWECWSAVAREALSRNRPLLATPRGGLVEAVEPGVSGWLAGGAGADDIERALRLVLDSRNEVDGMIASGGPERRLRELIQPDVTLARYLELASPADGQHAPPAAAPETVSVVITCSAGSGPLRRTLDSVAAQTVPAGEVLLACDGIERLPSGFDPSAVDSLELLPAGRGPAACRNAGIERSSTRLVLLLDAGTELQPQLLERLVAALRRNPDSAYATAWADGLDPSAVPLGNFANLVPEYDNAAATPLIRRAVFETGHRFDPSLGRCAERAFYAALASDGLYGCVLPERLASWVPFSAACTDGALLRRLADGGAQAGEALSWVAP